MSIDQFYEKLFPLLREAAPEEIENFFTDSLADADLNQEYDLYATVAGELVPFYQAIGAYDKAEQASNDLLLLLEELGQENTPYFALQLMHMGNGYRDSGKVEEADRCYRRALTILEDEEKEKPLKMTVSSNLGMLFLGVQQFDTAVTYFKQAKELAAEAGLSDDARALDTLLGLGEALFRTGELSQAVASYEEACSIILKISGPDEAYAMVCGNIAGICAMIGDAEKAEVYRKKQKAAVSEHTQE